MFSLKVMGKNLLILDGIAFKKNPRVTYKWLSIIVFLIVEGRLFLHYRALQVPGEHGTIQSVI